MKKRLSQVLLLFLLVPSLTGCLAATEPVTATAVERISTNTPEAHIMEATATVEETSVTPETVMTDTPIPTETATIAADYTDVCPTPSDGSVLYVDEANGFCLLYPEDFVQSTYKEFNYDRIQFAQPVADVSAPETITITLVVEVNGIANGQNSMQYAKRWVTNFSTGSTGQLAETSLNGQKAVNLSAETEFGPMAESVFISVNDTKYRLVFTPAPGTAPTLEPDLQNLWDLVTGSIVFFQPQSVRQYLAPEKVCPQPTGGYQQYIDLTEGYCLVYPADFDLSDDISGEFTGGPLLEEGTNWGDLYASLTVGTAGYYADQTVLDIVDTRMDQIDADSIQETTIAGYPAVIFVNTSGPWASQQAMIMVNQFVYTLVNQPYEPEKYPDGMIYVESIWNSVTGSLAFFDPWR